MPLSLFHLPEKLHYAEKRAADDYGHTFGGDPASLGLSFVNLQQPLHLLYRLNLQDPAVPIQIPGLKWLPLCYGFNYAKFDGKCIYRVLDDARIELVWPEEPEFDPDFPFKNYPRHYPAAQISFERKAYDPRNAEDALSMAQVFGFGELPKEEMKRAVSIVENTTDLIGMYAKYEWGPEGTVESMYPRPFIQGAPSQECENPNCTAEVVSQSTAIQIDPATIWSADDLADFAANGIDPSINLPSRPVRRDSLTLLALLETEIRESPVLDDIQLTFQICDACQCITVRNQCS